MNKLASINARLQVKAARSALEGQFENAYDGSPKALGDLLDLLKDIAEDATRAVAEIERVGRRNVGDAAKRLNADWYEVMNAYVEAQ